MMHLESLQGPALIAVIASAALSLFNGVETAPARLAAEPRIEAEAPQPITDLALRRIDASPIRVMPAAYEPGFTSAWAPALQPVGGELRGVAACLGCASH